MAIDQVESATGLDADKLAAFQGQVAVDLGTVLAGATTYIGYHVGLYAAMADARPVTPADLAARTGAHRRYLEEWLGAQAASGYVDYDPDDRTYRLPPEHAAVLADESSPAYLGGASDCMAGTWAAADRIAQDFTIGEGLPWHEHDPRLFDGTEELFRPSYETFLTAEWIPSLHGDPTPESRLRSGATVADVGCGHGISTIVMAQAYPASRFRGFDAHEASVVTAQARADERGVADRTSFEVAQAAELPGDGYDLVCFFDALHDMGDPVGALVRAREALADDGVVMLVEPFAGDGVEDNLTPVGRLYYAASTLVCTANGLAQGARPVLGAQAGEAALRTVLSQAGFSQVRRAAETPFNLVLEARP